MPRLVGRTTSRVAVARMVGIPLFVHLFGVILFFFPFLFFFFGGEGGGMICGLIVL